MCKYYSSYMVIIYASSSKQASSTWRMMIYLNRDMDGGPILVYFLPILGGHKTAVSNSAEGWCATPGLFLSYYLLIYVLFASHSWWAESCNLRLSRGWCAAGNLGASRVSIRMDDRTNGQRTNDGTHGFRGGFISHPDVLYYIGFVKLEKVLL